jgi:glycosyltransferase involved in cell wall biosynthesis
MAYPPNARGAELLVHRIMPIVRGRWPAVRTTLVGYDPPPSVQRAAQADQSIRVTGRVHDVAEFYRRATVVVIPIRTGTGTRVKLLEALSFGKAVVTTPKGVEGIAARHGVEALVADAPQAIAAAIADLLDDATLRRRLANAGRALIRSAYALQLGPEILRARSLLAPGARTCSP